MYMMETVSISKCHLFANGGSILEENYNLILLYAMSTCKILLLN
jgi:hypothetical protein